MDDSHVTRCHSASFIRMVIRALEGPLGETWAGADLVQDKDASRVGLQHSRAAQLRQAAWRSHNKERLVLL